MIYITGDTHGERKHYWSYRENPNWGEEDCIIVCGDFGHLFWDDWEETEFLDKLEQRPYTLCFVDGNHENFPAIFRYPQEVWNGGLVHRIRRNVFHLMRGQVFTIQGTTVFTFGGAASIDKVMRIPGRSWWPEELPTIGEYAEAEKNLERHGWQVDCILTHTAPLEIIRRMGYAPGDEDRELTGFLEYIMYKAKYQHWYFGHWHEDRDISERFTALWYDIRVLEGGCSNGTEV